MIYKIDNTAIARTDWTHTPIKRSPQTKRVSVFPGVGERFIVAGPSMPGGVVVEGFLQVDAVDIDAARQALITLVDNYSEMESDGSLHTVDLDSQAYTDAFLDRFDVAGRMIPIAVDSEVRMIRRCRFIWIETHD